MHLTALVESREHVCCRYRLAAYRPFLERLGHRLEFRPMPRSCWSRLHLARNLRGADVVILQRKLLPGWLLYLLRSETRLLLFDFDDAIFLRDSYSPRGLASVKRLHRFASTVEMADVVIAGNDYLRDQAVRWTDPDRVHVVPTCVNPDRYPLAEHVRKGGNTELVWIGSTSTLRGLEMIGPRLESLGRNVPGLRFKVICNRFLKLRHLPVIPRYWSEATEAADLAKSDIGISWIPDDAWSRGKCGLKVLQYMAAGLPVVANPVGVQANLVRHGETGFLARTAEEWIEAVRWLANDPELRRHMGQAGRRRVEAEFRTGGGAASWMTLLNGLRRAKVA